MTPEWREQVTQLYGAALELEPTQRAAFLATACNGDEVLRQEVASLLAYEARSGGLLDESAVAALRLEPSAAALSGERLGHYEMLSLLGRGGMGEVWLAEDTQLGRKVAVKLLPVEFTGDAERVRRFAQEARAASALNHPNIITIHEIGQAERRHYLVTEYIAGETLRARLSQAAQERLTVGAALDIATQIAAALTAAHEAGITHRDIKPENVIVRRDGLVKVLDFGLAKLTEASDPSGAKAVAETSTAAGVIMGTPRYMSPEQGRGEKVDARTDLFSFGVMLYEMLAGRPPFAGATLSELLAALLRDEPAPLPEDTPPALQNIVSRGLRKERTERYQSAAELHADLALCKEGMIAEKFVVSPSGGSVHSREIPPKGGTTNRSRLFIACAVGIIAIAIAAWAWFYFKRQSALTSRDTVLLADFDNKTGEAIFDGTLKQWLATQLEQARLLNVFPETRVRQTLRQMERLIDAPVTAEIAQEMCERQNLKAFIAGSIAPLGSRYVITLAAVAGQTGATLTSAQAQANNKEEVLAALSQATTQLGAQLNRSLSAIQPSARPLLQVTTPDLRAVKAYSECNDLAARGRFVEALPFARRAVELDPQLAGGYTFLALLSWIAYQPEAAAEYQRKAWELVEQRHARQPEQVSEVLKASAFAWYHRLSTGNLAKAQEYGLQYRQLATQYAPAHNDLGFSYNFSGQFEQALPSFEEAMRLNPNFAAPYRGMAEALTRLNRFAEAKAIITRALELKLEFAEYRTQLYQLAFTAGDAAGLQEQINWAKGKPEEAVALDWQTQAAAFAGQWRQAQELSRQAINLAALGENKELAARFAAEQALRSAAFGDCRSSRASVAQGLNFGRGRLPLARAALALALCGESRQAQSLVTELTDRFPEDTLSNALWVPTIRAALALQRGNVRQALEQLQGAARYEAAAAEFWPQYLRGQAYLQLQQGREAAAEFQKILDHRGYAPLAPLYALAHLGLARATHGRKAYDDFLTLWKDADADWPLWLTARKEAAQP